MAWTLTTIEIIKGALQLCQAIGVGENVNDEDADLCMDSLQGLMKELPSHGFLWPQLSNTPVAVAWVLGTPSVVTPPTDYFGAPVLKFTDASGQKVQLRQLTKQKFELLDLTKTATYPEAFYVSPNLAFNLWPAPTQNPGLTLTYQSVLPDLVLTGTPSIQQQYLNTLQFMLADEIALKYGVPQDVRVEISARAAQKKGLMMSWATDLAPIYITVDDDCYPRSGPFTWR